MKCFFNDFCNFLCRIGVERRTVLASQTVAELINHCLIQQQLCTLSFTENSRIQRTLVRKMVKTLLTLSTLNTWTRSIKLLPKLWNLCWEFIMCLQINKYALSKSNYWIHLIKICRCGCLHMYVWLTTSPITATVFCVCKRGFRHFPCLFIPTQFRIHLTICSTLAFLRSWSSWWKWKTPIWSRFARQLSVH